MEVCVAALAHQPHLSSHVPQPFTGAGQTDLYKNSQSTFHEAVQLTHLSILTSTSS